VLTCSPGKVIRVRTPKTPSKKKLRRDYWRYWWRLKKQHGDNFEMR
jgi:hypothetical protein